MIEKIHLSITPLIMILISQLLQKKVLKINIKGKKGV
jgi:hypothetical protein